MLLSRRLLVVVMGIPLVEIISLALEWLLLLLLLEAAACMLFNCISVGADSRLRRLIMTVCCWTVAKWDTATSLVGVISQALTRWYERLRRKLVLSGVYSRRSGEVR